MPEPNVVVDLVKNLGVPVALLLYFVYKDNRFTQQLAELMGRVTALLERLDEGKEGPTNGSK